MTRLLTALLALAACGMSPVYAQDCPWMSTADVNAAFPERAPWDVMAGGIGRCKFVSDPGQPASTFSLTQIMQADTGAAAGYVEGASWGKA